MIEYKGFIGSIEFHDDDNLYFGTVQNVRALIMYEGATPEEAENDFQGAVDDYLAFREAEGTRPEWITTPCTA